MAIVNFDEGMPHVIDTPIGAPTLVAPKDALREVRFPNGPPVGPTNVPSDYHPLLADAARQLARVLRRRAHEFDVPLDLQGTEFQRAAWQALTTIPYGETVSYGEQARRLGDDRKARAVGAVNGRNPITIILPCHRVDRR